MTSSLKDLKLLLASVREKVERRINREARVKSTVVSVKAQLT